MSDKRIWIGDALAEWDRLKAAKTELSEELIHKPLLDFQPSGQLDGGGLRKLMQAISPNPTQNVVGVGIGEKISGGKQTGFLSIKLLVRMKFGASDICAKHELPSEIDGIPTDVEEVGIFRRFFATPALNPKSRVDPAQPGCSIGFQDPTSSFRMAGTFGALVNDMNGEYLLSNNHVLADENALSLGAAIFQPGPLDSVDTQPSQVAELSRFKALQIAAKNSVDCAIAKVLGGVEVSNKILQIGAPQGTTEATQDMAVHKFGRTTGYTVGQIASINTDVKLQYDRGLFAFTSQILIRGNGGSAFSAAGDSGALILERGTNKALGLLVGGSTVYTVANHIDDVLIALNVSLS